MLQLRCTYCQTMFAISRDETLAGLERMEEEKLKFYDAHCPKCRRANRVERIKLEFSYPGWRNEIKKMAKEAAGTSQPAASAPAPAAAKAEPAAPARKKHGHKPAGSVTAKPAPKKAAAPALKAKPAAKPVAAKAVKKPAAAAARPAPKVKPAPAAKKPAPSSPKGKITGGAKKK
jgi:hypothetical protein